MRPEEMLERAIAAAEAGRREEARDILVDGLALDPASLEAWLRLADLATTPDRSILYLERALQIAPQSLRVQKRLEEVRAQVRGPGLPGQDTLEEPLAVGAAIPEEEQLVVGFPPPPSQVSVAKEEVLLRREGPPVVYGVAVPMPRQGPIFIADDCAPFSLDLSTALGEAKQSQRQTVSGGDHGGEEPGDPASTA